MNNRAMCAECGAIAAPWDKLFKWNKREWVCPECFDALMSELDRDELAERLDCEAVYAEELKS